MANLLSVDAVARMAVAGVLAGAVGCVTGTHDESDPSADDSGAVDDGVNDLGDPLSGATVSCLWAWVVVSSGENSYAFLQIALPSSLREADADFSVSLDFPADAFLAVAEGSSVVDEYPLVMECDMPSFLPEDYATAGQWWYSIGGTVDVEAVFQETSMGECGEDHLYEADLAIHDVVVIGTTGGIVDLPDSNLRSIRLGNNPCEG